MVLIFDMDGVLINSNAAHLASWQKIAQEDGLEFSPELFWRTFGMTSEFIVANYWQKSGLNEREIHEVVDRKETAFREMIESRVEPIEGAVEFVRDMADKGCKMAVGSSAPRGNVEFALEWLKIRDYFGEMVVAGNEVGEGKPAPDIFLKCAAKLGAAPETCVVIDDSRSGVLAGRRAGMFTVGFFSEGHREEEYEEANVVVTSYAELREVLKERF